MNYCIYIRKRKNKPFCKLKKEEILLSECNNCFYKEYKNNYPHKSGKMKNKSNKLAKLEKDRFSAFSNDKDICYLCGSTYNLTWHEIFRGANRRNSMKFGFCLRLCLNCHEEKQEDVIFNDFWHRQAQLYFEEYIGSREDFIKAFRRNYIIKKEEEDN